MVRSVSTFSGDISSGTASQIRMAMPSTLSPSADILSLTFWSAPVSTGLKPSAETMPEDLSSRTSIAPLVKETTPPPPPFRKAAAGEMAWKVVMHFRSESKGISATRGKSCSRLFLSKPFSLAMAYSATSVGSPMAVPDASSSASLLSARAVKSSVLVRGSTSSAFRTFPSA